MVLGSPVKRPARRAQAVPPAGLAVAVAATAMLLLLLLCAAALRCSPAFGCAALSAGTLWAGGGGGGGGYQPRGGQDRGGGSSRGPQGFSQVI